MTFTKSNELVVPEGLDGERLDLAAAALLPEYSRSRLQQWIKQGSLRFEGQVKRARDKVFAGGVISLDGHFSDEVIWQPQSIDLDIVSEDSSIIVVNKPMGMVVHPAAGHQDGTLVNALLNHSPALAKIPRAGIVHRLDKDTTGLLVVAKTLESHKSLVAQIQSKTIDRQYCALCVGVMTGGGTVNEQIGRHPRNRKKMSVVQRGGKSSVTHYRVTHRFKHFTQISVSLETGRTHQIRVHMSYIGYPILGDKTYGGKASYISGTSQRLIDMLHPFDRQALHAQKLTFKHPKDERIVSYEAAIPSDFEKLLILLQAEDSANLECRDDN